MQQQIVMCLGSWQRECVKAGGLFSICGAPEFFATHRGGYEFKTVGGVIRETKRVEGDRLFVHLVYQDGGQDNFEWQLFSPVQIDSMAESVGLSRLLTCTGFDETTSSSPGNPRVHFLFERRGASSTNIGLS
jgi:hypothetical protein